MHPIFAHPAKKDIAIWRYMDFTKFVSMLEGQGLYLCRADLLGDPFEGSVPRQSFEQFRQMLNDGKMPGLQADTALKSLSDLRRGFRREVYLNCWHASDVESAAMWSLYSKSNEAIAIQSDFSTLFNSIESDESKSAFYVGTVRYIDYEKDHMEFGNLLWPFVHKRRSFEHEKEIRVVHTWPSKPGEPWGTRETPIGIWKTVNLDRLISKIYVSPTCEQWFRELVRKTAKRFGINREVLQSDLNAAPMF